MDSTPPLDRGILLPILFGGFSIIGIIVVLMIGRSLNSPPPASASPSATQFQYIYLGTEPAITTPLTEESGIPFPTEPPVVVPIETTPAFLAPTSALTSPAVPTLIILTRPNTTSTSTRIVLRTSTPSQSPNATATVTGTLGTVEAADTYDDTDSRLSYSSGWTSQTGVSGAYQGTLHLSNANGNSVTFTFTSLEIYVYYQAGPSLGSMTITIDGLGGPAISQAQSQTQIKEWYSGLLTAGTHSIVITHSGGGSINIDKLVVPMPTLTPTRTPTSTPTP